MIRFTPSHTSFQLIRQTQSWYFKTLMEPKNRCQGINSASLCSLAGRYDNPIPTPCLAPIDFLKIPALTSTFTQREGRLKERERKKNHCHCVS